MGILFSGCEIVELGIQIEKNGRDFYEELAKKADDPGVAAMFDYLADEEDKHISVFQEISSSECKYEPGGAYPDEYFAYMNSLASQHVFTRKDKGKEIGSSIKDYKEGIDLAIQSEKDAILFYEGMKQVVPEKDKGLIDKLIAEEKKHLKQLCDSKGGCEKTED